MYSYRKKSISRGKQAGKELCWQKSETILIRMADTVRMESKYIELHDAETTAILSYDTKSDKLDMGLSLQIKKEGIISAMDILVNCAKSDSAKVISGIYASETQSILFYIIFFYSFPSLFNPLSLTPLPNI